MIAKIVDAPKGGGSFGGLADYITDKLKLTKGEKVENITYTNCNFTEHEDIVKEVTNTQALSKSKANKTLHLVVSFQEHEKPTPEQLKIIEEELIKSLGLQEQQRVSATHINTNNFHLHIAVNRIEINDNKKLHRIEERQEKQQLSFKSVLLEEKLGLQKDNHGKLAEKYRKTNIFTKKEIDDEQGQRKELTKENRRGYNRDIRARQRRASVYQSTNTKITKRTTTKRLDNLRSVSECDLVQNNKKSKMLLQSNEFDKLDGDRDADYRMRWASVSDYGNGATGVKTNPDIKKHSGVENLTSWIANTAAAEIKEALANSKDIQDIHKVLAKYNLELKERGSGLIIKDKSRNLFCKASDIDRRLTKKSLEREFGKFELKNQDFNIKPTMQFSSIKPNPMFDKYKAEMDDIKAYKAIKSDIREKYIQRVGFAKSITSKKLKSSTLQKVYSDQKKELEKATIAFLKNTHNKNLKEQFESGIISLLDVDKSWRNITYNQYLVREAIKGNHEALALLRKNPIKPKTGENYIGGEDSNKLFVYHDPKITKDGYVVYMLDIDNDRSKIIDNGNHLKILDVSDIALLEAIKMAQSKYGNMIDCFGDDNFRARVVMTVKEHNLNITFTDEKLNLLLGEEVDQLKEQEVIKEEIKNRYNPTVSR